MKFQYVGRSDGEVTAYGGVQTENRVFECPPEFEDKAKANPEFEAVADDFKGVVVEEVENPDSILDLDKVAEMEPEK